MTGKRRRFQFTKAELLERMRVANALRSTKPLRPDQLTDLSLCHHVNLDAVCSGDAGQQMLMDFAESVFTWWKVAELLQVGRPEMDVQLEVAARLTERWQRTGRVLFDGPDMQLARDGVAIMDELAALVDTATAWQATMWARREVERLQAAAQQMLERTQDAGATTAGAA